MPGGTSPAAKIPGVTCLSKLIDKNAVVCSETRGLSKLSVRYRSNPHHDEVRLDCPDRTVTTVQDGLAVSIALTKQFSCRSTPLRRCKSAT